MDRFVRKWTGSSSKERQKERWRKAIISISQVASTATSNPWRNHTNLKSNPTIVAFRPINCSFSWGRSVKICISINWISISWEWGCFKSQKRRATSESPSAKKGSITMSSRWILKNSIRMSLRNNRKATSSRRRIFCIKYKGWSKRKGSYWTKLKRWVNRSKKLITGTSELSKIITNRWNQGRKLLLALRDRRVISMKARGSNSWKRRQ